MKVEGEKGDVKVSIDGLRRGRGELVVYGLGERVLESVENGVEGMVEKKFRSVKRDYEG